MIITHDPSEYIKGIQQLLISDKKRIGFLFGAGSSMAKKNNDSLTVPSVWPLTNEIVNELSVTKEEYKVLFEELKEELVNNFNIETILSNLEQKVNIVGKGSLNGLNKLGFEELIKDKKFIQLVDECKKLYKDEADEKEKEKLKEVYNYYENNKDALVRYMDRENFNLETDQELRDLGTMEGSVHNTLATRTKYDLSRSE